MNERQLTPLDRLLSGINQAMNSTPTQRQRVTRANPAGQTREGALSPEDRKHAAGLMRVNHAGEIAAQGLYQGHALVSRRDDVREQLEQAAAEELDHLDWCEQRLTELNAKPSTLSPLWYAGAFAIGAASGVLGDRWSLGFVKETEHQVAEHLTGHMKKLPDQDARSLKIVEQMRSEEEQHGANAAAAGAAELPDPVKQLMRLTAGVMTRTAYWI